MANQIRRYKRSSAAIQLERLEKFIPSASNVDLSETWTYVDVTVDDSHAADTNDVLTRLGWIFVAADPVDPLPNLVIRGDDANLYTIAVEAGPVVTATQWLGG